MTDVNSAAGPVPEATRSQLLNAEVAKYVRQGWTAETTTAGQAVLSKNKRIGWFWNLILVGLTGGLWLIARLSDGLGAHHELSSISERRARRADRSRYADASVDRCAARGSARDRRHARRPQWSQRRCGAVRSCRPPRARRGS